MNNMRIDGQNWFSGLALLIWIFLPSLHCFQKRISSKSAYRWSFPSLMIFILTCATQIKNRTYSAPFVVMVFIVLVLGIIRVVQRTKKTLRKIQYPLKFVVDKRLFILLVILFICRYGYPLKTPMMMIGMMLYHLRNGKNRKISS